MRRAELRNLKAALLDAGVADRYVHRTLSELSDHLQDVEADARASGFNFLEARRVALEAIGSKDAIVSAIAAHPELMRWTQRWPRAAQGLEQFCFYTLLPAAPFVYCTERSAAIGRWGLSTSLAALVTVTLLFSLQWFFT